MLLTLGGGGGGMYKVAWFAYLMLGGSWGMLPQENYTSGAFSSKFTQLIVVTLAIEFKEGSNYTPRPPK